MICPLFATATATLVNTKPELDTEIIDGIEACYKAKCGWYDEKKKQCCIKTLAQKDNSKVSIAR